MKIFLFLVPLLFITSCSSLKVSEYKGIKPTIDVFEFFQGDLVASGIVKNRSGKVIRHFNADITAYIENETLILEEVFLFSDGETDERRWKISRAKANHYVGVASDISGPAKGESAGNALRWQYDMQLEVGDRSVKVAFDDWMYQTSGDTLINISDISKWGFKVGEVVLVIIKKG